MARVVLLEGNPGPVNRGEKRVIDLLQSGLPDTCVLIPNLTVPFRLPARPAEYDVIVVTPDVVFVVEVKDLAADVEVTEQEMYVGGARRSNPYLSSRIKAQMLKNLISERVPWFARAGWVDHLVILARRPAALSVCDAMQMRVVVADECIRVVGEGSPLVENRYRGSLAGRADELVDAITDGAHSRVASAVFGQYDGVAQLIDRETFEVWRARHRLSHDEVLLEVFPRPADLSPAQIAQWKRAKLALFDVARELGPSADLDSPRDVFELDNGTLVVVCPTRDNNIYPHFINQMQEPGSGFDAARARSVAAGFAEAFAHVHRNGRTLGTVADYNLVVRPTGRGAVVLGDPAPAKNDDMSADLAQLASLLDRMNQLVDDDLLRQCIAGLTAGTADERWSADFVALALDRPDAAVRKERPGVLEQFADRTELGSHRHGASFVAIDPRLDRKVLVKYESGRPEPSWALREYRILSLPQLANNPNVVSVVNGGDDGNESWVATELLESPTLASLIDSGALSSPEAAASMTARLLTVLDALHPDIRAIQQVIDAATGVLDDDQVDAIGALRDAGVAHNHLDPSNIFVDPVRGPVLVDFVRAARFGEVIPDRRPRAWPPEMSSTESSPLADIYAVGDLLLQMLSPPEQRRSAGADKTVAISGAGSALVALALRALDPDPGKRFLSAREFLDSLLAEVAVGEVPVAAPDVFALQQQIEALVREGRFDDALALCPPGWTVTRERIESKRDLIAGGGTVLLAINGVELRHIGTRPLPPGVTSGNTPHEGGTSEVYRVVDSDGGVIEVLCCVAHVDKTTHRWVRAGAAFGYPDRLSDAVRSLRMSVEPKAGVFGMELTQARLRTAPKTPNDTIKKKSSISELSSPLDGQDVAQIFKSFGALAVGTKQDLWSETNRHKTYLAVLFPETAVHVPAVAHFICRVIPLYAGMME